MTPKQKYEERKRLRAERLLAREQKLAKERYSREDADEAVERVVSSFERVADAIEFWVESQIGGKN